MAIRHLGTESSTKFYEPKRWRESEPVSRILFRSGIALKSVVIISLGLRLL